MELASMRTFWIPESKPHTASSKTERRLTLIWCGGGTTLATTVTDTVLLWQAFSEAAAATGATLLPFLLDGVAGNEELNQPDGIHPNAEGSRIVAERLWAQLSPALRARLSGNGRATAPAPIDPGAGVR